MQKCLDQITNEVSNKVIDTLISGDTEYLESMYSFVDGVDFDHYIAQEAEELELTKSEKALKVLSDVNSSLILITFLES